MAFLRQLIDANEREVVRLRKTVVETNALEPEISRLSDSELQAKTPEFKERIAAGETVVSSATFLIDAESNLGSALGAMTNMPGMDHPAKKP